MVGGMGLYMSRKEEISKERRKVGVRVEEGERRERGGREEGERRERGGTMLLCKVSSS